MLPPGALERSADGVEGLGGVGAEASGGARVCGGVLVEPGLDLRGRRWFDLRHNGSVPTPGDHQFGRLQ